jgi:hypothetical protein
VIAEEEKDLACDNPVKERAFFWSERLARAGISERASAPW